MPPASRPWWTELNRSRRFALLFTEPSSLVASPGMRIISLARSLSLGSWLAVPDGSSIATFITEIRRQPAPSL